MRAMASAAWAAPFAAAPGWGEGPWPGGWGMHYMWGAWGLGMMVFMLVFWVLLIAGAVALVRWLWTGGRERPAAGGGGAEEILRARYARGEIDREEFQARLQDLRRN